MIKIISLFLIAMAVLAIFGRLRFPAITLRKRPTKCPSCDRPMIGKGPCDCGHKGKS